MAGASNAFTVILNLIAILCSVPIIVAGVFLASKPDNECIHLFRWPVLILGILILLVALAGFVGALWNRQSLLAFYLFCMAVLIVLVLIVLILSFVVTRKDGGYVVVGREYKEYRLDGFSGWLRTHVTDSGSWGKISTCVAEADVCGKLDTNYVSAAHFFSGHISPLQSGCCKPPTLCGFSYVNPTLWVNPTNPAADIDCSLWSNEQTQLCYGCNACKAGLLGNLRKEWRKANVFLIVALIVLIFVYTIGCNAFKNAQSPHHKQGGT